MGSPPHKIATIQIANILSSDATLVTDVSPVFLSDEVIALLVRCGTPRSGQSHIVLLQLIGGGVKAIAIASKENERDEIFAVAGGRALVAARFHKYLYSRDLKARDELPIRVLSQAFPRSSVAGEVGEARWKTYSLTSPPTLRKEGIGSLLSVSDDVIVYRQADVFRTESLSGVPLGTIPAKPDTRGSPIAEIAGKTSLYFSSAEKKAISDFNGMAPKAVRPPEGWGFRHGWSADGRRMLFDHYTRAVSAWEKMLETAVDGLGFSSPEQPNGEKITTVDTITGGTCFDLESPRKLLGSTGGFHADLAPSGNLVAVATVTELNIYQLPSDCTEK